MPTLNRRSFTAGTVALLGTGPALARSGSWSEFARIPIQTQEIYPTVLNRQIVVAGGLAILEDGELGISDRVDAVNMDGSWTEFAPLPEPRHHPNLVAQGGRIHAIGGFRAGNGGAWNMIANTTIYDPETDGWTEAAPMPAPYGETVAASLNGQVHVATGRQPTGDGNANWNDHGDVGAHYVYDAAEDRWRTAAPNPNPRNSAAGTVLNGRLHVVGGRRVNAGNNANHETYDPSTDSWQVLAPMPQAQGGLAAAVANGRLYAFGGEWFADGGGVYPQVWIYDPQADAWSEGPAMRTPRHGLGGLTIDGRIFAIGGATQRGGVGTSNLIERLDP